MAPPKMPRNIFFPWQNFILHQSGSFLEPNRVAFRVPVNMTKLDIRDYLRKLYGVKVIKVNTYVKLPKTKMSSYRSWFKTDAQYKKAIVTCEETIPDEVKMVHSSRELRLNPAVTKGMLDPKITRGNPARPGQSRSQDWKPRHQQAWREPIPLLMRGDPQDRPNLFTALQERELNIDPTLPFSHSGNERRIPLGVPSQTFPRPNAKLITNSRRGIVRGKASIISTKLASNPNLVQ
jgi:large subunit ribosomal protein L23